MLSSRSVSLHDVSDYSRFAASKTPGRSLKGRAGLQENVLQNGSMTANPKEKRVALQTPFRQGTGKMILQDAPASSKTAITTRPLGDKTPLVNRQNISLFTPGPRNGKNSKLVLPPLRDEDEAGSPGQPPSSSRKKIRAPRTSKTFETPVTKGDHWNVSDVSIDVGTASIDEVNEADPNEPDYSDPEYMPPKTVEAPYEPPFKVPDYKEVGSLLRTLAYTYPEDDTPYVYKFDSEDLLKGCDWSPKQMNLALPESDEDEIFGPRKSVSTAKPNGKAALTRTGSRPAITRATSGMRTRSAASQPPRPATSAAIRAPDPKPAPVVSRPGTSASNSRRPLTRNTTGTGARGASSSTRSVPPAKRSSDDVLSLQLNDELEVEDDFRFDV